MVTTYTIISLVSGFLSGATFVKARKHNISLIKAAIAAGLVLVVSFLASTGFASFFFGFEMPF